MSTEKIVGKAVHSVIEAFAQLNERMRDQQATDVLKLQEEWTEAIAQLTEQFPDNSEELLDVEAHLDAFAFVLRRSNYLMTLEEFVVLQELAKTATAAAAALIESLEIDHVRQRELQQAFVQLLLQTVDQHYRHARFSLKVEAQLQIAEMSEMVGQSARAADTARRLKEAIDTRRLDRLAG